MQPFFMGGYRSGRRTRWSAHADRLRSGTVIFAKGDSGGDRLYIIASGKVKISDATTSDRESILAVMGALGHVR